MTCPDLACFLLLLIAEKLVLRVTFLTEAALHSRVQNLEEKKKNKNNLT